MGIKLMLEALDHAPATLTPTERLLLIVLAERAPDDTREAWAGGKSGWGVEVIARRVGVKVETLQKIFWSMDQKGLALRVPLRMDKNGKPVYAHVGKQTTFKIPQLPLPPKSPDDNLPSKPGKPRPQSEEAQTTIRERADQDPEKPRSASAPIPDCPSPETSLTEQTPRAAASVISTPETPDEERGETAMSGEVAKRLAGQLIATYEHHLNRVERGTLGRVVRLALMRGWTYIDVETVLDRPLHKLDDIAAGLIARVNKLGDPPPLVDQTPCPLHVDHYGRPYLALDCDNCRSEVKTGDDPFNGNHDRRHPDWPLVYGFDPPATTPKERAVIAAEIEALAARLADEASFETEPEVIL